jgi:hypothetical protein
MFMCRGKAIEHDERGGAEGAGRGEREADDTTRGGDGADDVRQASGGQHNKWVVVTTAEDGVKR